MPVGRINEVSVHADTGALYVSVSVWATQFRMRQFPNRPDLANDFLFDISLDGTRVLGNEAGEPVLDGGGNPVTEPYTLTRAEVRAMVAGEVRAWVRRQVAANRTAGDDRSPWLRRNRDDRRGLLAEAEGMVSEEFTE